jgi:prolyl-tRNA synthetase
MIYEAVGADGKAWLAAVLIRGDLTINEVKLPKAIGALHVKLASEEILGKTTGTRPGFVGPLGLLPFEENPVLLFVDRSLEHGRNLWCGANREGLHHSAVDIVRDVMSVPAFKAVVEVATARDGDPSPAPKGGTLRIKRGIEVGHIFKLGTKYSEAMKCEVADQAQKMVPLAMGCYGLGLGRTASSGRSPSRRTRASSRRSSATPRSSRPPRSSTRTSRAPASRSSTTTGTNGPA